MQRSKRYRPRTTSEKIKLAGHKSGFWKTYGYLWAGRHHDRVYPWPYDIGDEKRLVHLMTSENLPFHLDPDIDYHKDAMYYDHENYQKFSFPPRYVRRRIHPDDSIANQKRLRSNFVSRKPRT